MTAMGSLLLTLLLALPTAERCAAMLLSPAAEVRKAAEDALSEASSAAYRDAVLGVLTKRAHSRAGWVAALESELPDSTGPRHKQVRELLRVLKHSTEDNIGVDVVMISMPKAAAIRVLGDGLPGVVYRDGAQWTAWRKSLGTSTGVEELFRTSMPGKDGLDVHVEKKRQVAYVKEFEFDGKIGHPVIDQLEEGLFLKWRPVLSRDGAHVTLDFDIRLVDLVRPIAVKEKTIQNMKVRIQVPEQTETRERLSITLPLTGCAAFRFQTKGANVTVVFVRARIR